MHAQKGQCKSCMMKLLLSRQMMVDRLCTYWPEQTRHAISLLNNIAARWRPQPPVTVQQAVPSLPEVGAKLNTQMPCPIKGRHALAHALLEDSKQIVGCEQAPRGGPGRGC
jgi:hypothetical protein